MKSFILLAFFSASAFAAPVYTCGNMTVTVLGTEAKPLIKIEYPTAHGVVHISSDSQSEIGEDDHIEIKNPTVMAGFAYPNGDMYVMAEGDTNEEGFTFVIDSAAFKNAKKVKAATAFWSDWHNTEIEILDCVRK